LAIVGSFHFIGLPWPWMAYWYDIFGKHLKNQIVLCFDFYGSLTAIAAIEAYFCSNQLIVGFKICIDE
jgi:hypothetical protein